MRVPVVLHGISSFDQDILESSATPVLNGLSRCISSSEPLRNEIIISPDFWSILQRLHQHEESAPLVVDLLQSIVDSRPPAISADNYESAVSLANDFASAGSVGSIEERKRDALARRSRGAKQEKVRYVVAENDRILHFSVFHANRKQRKSSCCSGYQGHWYNLPDDGTDSNSD
jgi:brefeldin A-resistance guanine nucleotide exchange factor 1